MNQNPTPTMKNKIKDAIVRRFTRYTTGKCSSILDTEIGMLQDIDYLLPDGYVEEGESDSPNGIILFENVQQRLIEMIADYLDSEDLNIDEAASGYKDPEPREKTELHIRMGKAAFAEYKRTVVSTNPLKQTSHE